MVHLRTFSRSCDEAVAWATTTLAQAGLQVTRSFDLQAARATGTDCPCPHHGTARCDCQLVVLLVYGNAGPPATLVVHGRDGRTWLTLSDAPAQQADATLAATITRTVTSDRLSVTSKRSTVTVH